MKLNANSATLILFLCLLVWSSIYLLSLWISQASFFLEGDEYYYAQSPIKDWDSALYKVFARIPSFTTALEIPRIIQAAWIAVLFRLSFFKNGAPFIGVVVAALVFGSMSTILIRDPALLICFFLILTIVYDTNIGAYNKAFVLAITFFVLANLAFEQLVVILASLVIANIKTLAKPKVQNLALIALLLAISLKYRDLLTSMFLANFIEGARAEGDIPLSASGIGEGVGLYISGFARFLFGPGVLRLLSSERFFESNYPTLYLSSYWAYQLGWYGFILWSLSFIRLCELRRLLSVSSEFRSFIYFWFLFVSIYVFSTGGSAGYRKRLIAAFLIGYIIVKYKRFLTGRFSLVGLFSAMLLIALSNIIAVYG